MAVRFDKISIVTATSHNKIYFTFQSRRITTWIS